MRADFPFTATASHAREAIAANPLLVPLDRGGPRGGHTGLVRSAVWRARLQPTLDETKARRFDLAHRALGSRVQQVERSVYELAADMGQFDLVFCGDLLVHLKDPIMAVQRMKDVCRGSTIICNPVKRFRFPGRRPLVEFDGIEEFQWWLMSEAATERMLTAVGFARVEVGPSFELPATGGEKWKGLRAVMRGFVS